MEGIKRSGFIARAYKKYGQNFEGSMRRCANPRNVLPTKKAVTIKVTARIPAAGFEPAIFTLKG
jgi:hypothetical protein